MAGCVSLSWIATWSGNASKLGWRCLNLPDDVGDRAGDEEVLLLEAQLLPLLALIVRVEDLRYVLGVYLLLDRAPEVPLVEELQIEVAGRARRPQAQGIGGVGAVPHDERVVGDADDRAGVDPRRPRPSLPVLVEDDPAAETNRLRVLVPGQLPGVAELEPVVVLLELAATLYLLLEHPEVVADAVADRGQLQRRERIHEAGGQAPEAAVAEPRIPLALEDLAEIEAVIRGQGHRGVVQIHVHQAQAKAPAGEELGGEVADPLDVLLEVRPLRGQPAVDQPIAHRVRERMIEVERRGVANLLRKGVDHVSGHGGPEVRGVRARPPAARDRARPPRSRLPFERGLGTRGDRHGVI